MFTVLSKSLRMATSASTRIDSFKKISSLKFDNKVLRTLPIDKEKENFVRQVPNACFSLVSPTPVKNPQLVASSPDAMRLVNIDINDPNNAQSMAEYFSGNKIIPGSQTAAHCYCGHQFGAFSGQLGDGAAIYLGEVINHDSERWEMQLKGAGSTPYSRHADGRKVLRSSIREFLCSEIMYYLGVPTTRAGTIVTSDSTVVRDQFYDGNARDERCTIVLRIAPTFIRFGSFEICKPEDSLTGRSGPSVGNSDILTALLDYVIETFYSELWQSHGRQASEQLYLDWFKEVVERTAKLVAEWQCVGFCHGVLNTDNMSIIGLTIDYGPFGFMDRFDPEFICNSSDDGGRYTYAKQPEICKWNCEKLAHALKDQMPQEESLRILEESYYEVFNKHYLEKMKKKLGIIYSENSNDKNLIDGLLSTMHKTGADFTNTWRVLTNLSYEFDTNSVVEDCLVQCCSIDEVRESLKPTMPRREMQMMLMVLQSNPGLLEQLGRGALRLVNELNKMEKLEELKNDTNESKKEKDKQLWTDWLELYRSRLSDDLTTVRKNDDYLDTANRERATLMNAVNPRFVLRNHLAEEAIILAEKGDFSGVRSLLGSFEYVYNRGNGIDSSTGAEGMSASIAHYEIKPPPSAMKLKVS